MQSPAVSNSKLSIREILFIPLGCLITASPIVVAVTAAIVLVVGLFVYYNVNADPLQIWGPPFNQWTITASYDDYKTADNQEWKITYEYSTKSAFQGLVRHASPIREGVFPMLTHDILVTSGDFANSNMVATSVVNHHFTWLPLSKSSPQGTINLLHVVPKNDEVYQHLMQVQNGAQVIVKGREILKIDAFAADGKYLGFWADAGCNSILVESVEILK